MIRGIRDPFTYCVRIFVTFVPFVAQLSWAKRGSHKGHQEHKGKTQKLQYFAIEAQPAARILICDNPRNLWMNSLWTLCLCGSKLRRLGQRGRTIWTERREGPRKKRKTRNQNTKGSSAVLCTT